MQKKYIDGHISAQDPEGLIGCLYQVESPDTNVKWIFADSTADGLAVQYWSFDKDKKLIDGGEMDTVNSETDLLEQELIEFIELPEEAKVTLEDDFLDLSDLEVEGFTGM